ncbi:flagellar assembly protein FliX [Candidatus Midichloria mitochondrii]|uniref:Uncharacterized protein n=1 Tax=Midichloria mitochondrii (strain IricVA) TaxID=696127 RepID=F7XWY5_MIDMI|nr:flagellar assembly protein FliX [Candidatus Midichloria mitochondrii]AEI89184.1 hypothetical protein midi_00900 [Candidatus Midichloria mitochondrii IricVA]
MLILLRKQKKTEKKIKHVINKFESISDIDDTNTDKKIFNAQPTEQTLFLLQEIDDNKSEEEILEKAKELLMLLEQYRIGTLSDEVNLKQLKYIVNYIREIKKDIFNPNILTILSRIETLSTVELAKSTLKNN